MERKKRQYILISLAVCALCWTHCAIAAYSLNTRFGENGQVSESLGGISNRGHGIVVQPDGAIIVAGSKSSAADHDFSLFRLLPDGSYDTSFNGDGRVVTAIGNADDEILAVELLSDGRIIAAGYSESDTDRDFALACYNSDGSLDRTFGDEGVVVMEVGQQHDEITALAITEKDDIVIAGVAEGTNGRIIVVGRFDSSGTPDQTFGELGICLVGVGEDAVAQGVVVQGNGSIVISGSYFEEKQLSLFLVGLHEDGSIDADFGIEGIAMAPPDIDFSEGFGVALSDAEELYLAGSAIHEEQSDAVLFRFTADGHPDMQFEGKGYTNIYAGPEDDVIYAVQVINTEQVVVTGYATKSGMRRFLMATYSLTGSDAKTFEQARAVFPESITLSALKVESGSIDGNAEENPQEIEIQDSFEEFLNSGVSAGVLKRLYAAVTGFFVEEAVADELDEVARTQGRVNVTLLDTERVDAAGLAVAATPGGDIVVVGTDIQDGADSIVVANFFAGEQPGAASPYVRTIPVTAVTRTGALTGGRITGKQESDILKKGVVYATDPFPQYPGNESTTDNGSGVGTGQFIAQLEHLKPGTTFYARAYIALANGEVEYGDQIRFYTPDSCFIATASYGSLFHPAVALLREFRDTCLQSSALGRQLVNIYYTVSPPIADVIASSEPLRLIVRIMLLPFLGFSWLALQLGMWQAALASLCLTVSGGIVLWSLYRKCTYRIS